MGLQRDDRVRINLPEYPDVHGLTGTVVGTLDEWIYERYGDGIQSVMMKYTYRKVDAIVELDYLQRELAIGEDHATLLSEESDVKELEVLYRVPSNRE